jgi:hypothetical protein
MLSLAGNMLVKTQNSDGGWGAIAGKRSNTEATALALLALDSTSADTAIIDKAKNWLSMRQFANGSWPLNDTAKESSWSTALAALALGAIRGSNDDRRRAIKAAAWLLDQAGGKPGFLAKIILLVKGQKQVVRLDQNLIGWPWTEGNFSWVEPTSYCLIAVKKLQQSLPADKARERIAQAERLIYDRICDGGGWNYGNSEVFGEKLWPYPDVTALALIATHNHPERRENQLSLGVLRELALKTDSGLALSWALICHAVYGFQDPALKNALEQRFARSKFLDEIKTLALSILALSEGGRYFRV